MALEVKNLSISFPHLRVINNFTYQFNQNGLYLFVATNGSGKTSIFRSILGLIHSKNNGITIDDKPMAQMRRSVFYYESSNWFDINMSGMDYLKLIKTQWKSNVKINAVIHFWKMENYVNKSIRKYSLGMKQKLLIALYLISDADYLIMDEINNGLDEDSRKKLLKKLNELSQHKCIIISSHYKDEVYPYADKILTIKDHEVINDNH
ncbi:ABC transporter ATP-binding protein [Philodulcilactobacillus myokoensis]|uniref:ABC transporter ATP-binding protein n=1 Tax=Philodulcilactobacillus myokoensis TaxID=2929573 RepID=A0A9W6ETR5_9LACO|nr:ATP-binding cassette domain-containing protein [Philodulcilactobacillus myokoensis]GLB47572.1 ABC transporter ATP-binding protein [Philodulcilactobacillus myokoensis]